MHLSRTCAPLPEPAYATTFVISILDLLLPSLPLSLSLSSLAHTATLTSLAHSRAPFVVAQQTRCNIQVPTYLPTYLCGATISRNRRVSISPIYSILRAVVTPRINDRESTTRWHYESVTFCSYRSLRFVLFGGALNSISRCENIL